jgi:4-aminobutyrate--pyruvate transaminase
VEAFISELSMTHAPNSLGARDAAYVVHPYTNLRAHERQGPVMVTRGEGVWVWDDDGKQFLEGLAGLWCTGLGFSEKRLVEAARRQMERLPYSQIFAHRSTEPVVELAERLVGLAPEPLKHVLFCNGGSEAIDSAIKVIWYYNNAKGRPEKKKVISRKRAYHGVSVAAGHLTALEYTRAGFDLPMIDRFRTVTTPSHYRDGHPDETEEQFATRLAEELDALIIAEGPDSVAAFFAEPVMGAGGVIVPPRTYFEKVQAVLRKHDVLFVADEVINGFGRTGNMWGCDTYGIRPDLLTCAKQLSSAYLPIAGLLMSDEVYQTIADASDRLSGFGMGVTYAGHPVAAAVALETLRIYETDNIIGHVQAVAPRFQERLRALARHALVGEARGVGLIGGVELVRNKANREQFDPATKAAAQVAGNCLKHGLMLRPLPGDVVGICPPLIIKPAEIDHLFDRLEAALDDAVGAMPMAA